MKDIKTIFNISPYSRLSSYKPALILSIIIGFITGISLSFFLIITSDPNYENVLYNEFTQLQMDNKLSSNNIIERVHERENTKIAEELYDKVKILCWVATKPENHQTRAKYVQWTWGKRCNKLIFISTEDDDELGAIAITPEVTHLWATTLSALKYIYENYLNEYDWFLKADDDTYVILENLRYMLYPHNSDTPIWFGSKYQSGNDIYNKGGSGYVLSREALRLFNEVTLVTPPDHNCNVEGYGYDDFEIAKCFGTSDIINGDSRDNEGRTRFHSVALHDMFETEDNREFMLDGLYYKTGMSMNYSSDYPISFDYLSPGFTFTLEYLTYHLRPYGIWSSPKILETEKYTTEDELRIIKEAEKDKNIK